MSYSLDDIFDELKDVKPSPFNRMKNSSSKRLVVAKKRMAATQKPTRGLKASVKCQHCNSEFEARVADVNRGWGRYCSKSCKASAFYFR